MQQNIGWAVLLILSITLIWMGLLGKMGVLLACFLAPSMVVVEGT